MCRRALCRVCWQQEGRDWVLVRLQDRIFKFSTVQERMMMIMMMKEEEGPDKSKDQ